MKLLVAVQDYPNNFGGKNGAFVHTRNLEYVKSGISVTVMNFSAADGYLIDGIAVKTEREIAAQNELYYDFLLCHAANIRNHYRFIKRYRNRFKKIFFFFHGHEILKIHQVYPKDYSYVKTIFVKTIVRDIYDALKCKLWHQYFKSTKDNYYCIFVSHWMYHEFQKWIKVNIDGKYSIIYNVVGTDFINNHYDALSEKEYDFVTIRTNLDGSKYCMDLVNEIAKRNPFYKFLVIGKGTFFNFNQKAENLIWLNTTMNHNEIIQILDKCKCALMPTKTDAQGVMACEFATYGIPMITSDIEVCREVFDVFSNVAYINNDNAAVDIDKLYFSIKDKSIETVSKYDLKHTVMQEIRLLERAMG
jgi:glycosyltransferase involved in cell wall biosynthesis